ncbi:acyltransferase domain-containing protein [Streptomyces rectiviolaceus]|uniref:Acyltransferase domain-containing protein n=1 Tax=Streptomyces rectiviolaceus TaxID=332591 RepID=A0ABP6MZ44_9ACTN
MLDVLRNRARADERLAAWLKDLEGAEAPRAEAVLPSADELPDVLLDLAVPHEDINDLVALRRRLVGDPEARWLLDRSLAGTVRDMGKPGAGPQYPALPVELGALGTFFYVYVFVAALPYVRAYHRSHGIPDDISRRTLADLGRHIAVHRRARGGPGLLHPSWNSLHFRGELYQLGRLQFQRAVLGERMGGAVAAAGHSAGRGDPCLNLHITDFRGPLSPEACDRSMALAREFFARHFPMERYETAVCHSWLLDPQLKRYLPTDANIVRFQERFRPAAGYEREPEDSVPVAFVFGDQDLPVAELPRRTRVERAVGDHLRAGGHWYVEHGWFPL